MDGFFEFEGFPLIALQNLEGNYVEEYSEANIRQKQTVLGVNLQLTKEIGLPTPAPDPRSGVFGTDVAATGFYSAGFAFYKKQDYDKAIANFSKAIEIKPNHFFAFKFRALTYYEQKKYDLAISDFTESIRLNPINTGKMNKKSIDVKNPPEDLKFGLAESYNGRGNAYDEKGEYDKAIADYNKAISLNPNSAEPFNNRGYVYLFRKKEYDKAITDINKALGLKPDYAQASSNLLSAFFYRGFSLFEKREYDLAISDYSEVIRLDPKCAEAFGNRGEIYLEKKDYDRAIADFNEALKIKPDLEGINELQKKAVECKNKL